MDEMTIAHSGRLHLRQIQGEDESGNAPAAAILEAFRISPAHGMLALMAGSARRTLPPDFEFVRAVTRSYFSTLSRLVANEPGKMPEAVEPGLERAERLQAQAPPMTGLEYLTTEAITGWWSDLDTLVREETSRHPEGVAGILSDHYPQWRHVGRVTFHLAENKRNPDFPFAFLATFASDSNAQGRTLHEPLGNALKKYAAAGDRKSMIHLLLPVSRAAEKLRWVNDLVESGEIYRPLVWSPREAFEMLKSVPELEAAGLIIRVPDWWNPAKPPRPVVNVKIDTRDQSSIGVDTLLNFSVDICLDGESLSREEIQFLADSAGGLVPLKGKWVEIDNEKLDQALTHWRQVEKSVRRDGISFYEGMRMLAGANLEPGSPESTTVSSVHVWSGLTAGPRLEELLTRMRSPESLNEKSPPGLKATLRPYQSAGYGWLKFLARLGLGACLADDMGLGKTVQVISLLLDLNRDKLGQASLLIVPASLIPNWKSELQRFAPDLKFSIFHPSAGTDAQQLTDQVEIDDFDLVVTTYGMVTRSERLRSHQWRLAILDEAQAIKNSGTRQTKAVKEIKAASRIAMTGTPVENRMSDLWSLFDFLNPGLLGNSKRFARFVKEMQSPPEPSFEPLRKLVGPYILRRMKTDKKIIQDLPEKTEVTAWCTLTKTQAALYRKTVDDLGEQLTNTEEGMQRRGIVLANLMRLKQICNHPAQATGSGRFAPELSGKFERLGDIADEIASRQEKVLVFTQFREMTEPIANFLETRFGSPGLILHGGTTVKKRQEVVKRFGDEDGPPFFVLSLKAGGTGLNLTAASHVVHFDRWWNPAIENQATDRAFRIGQRKNVLVHKFVCQGTLEERIDEMLMEKAAVASSIIGSSESGETLLTEMDNATLMEFVSLNLTEHAGD